MAFSTQKDFYLISDLCQRPDEKNGVDVKCPPALKSYLSCTDYRAWSLSKEDQTKYLLDFISGDMHLRNEGSGDRANQNIDGPQRTKKPTEPFDQTTLVAGRAEYGAEDDDSTGGIIDGSVQNPVMASKESLGAVSRHGSAGNQKSLRLHHNESSSVVPIYEYGEVISVDDSNLVNKKQVPLSQPLNNHRHETAKNSMNEKVSIISLTDESLTDIHPKSIVDISSSIDNLGIKSTNREQISSGKIPDNEMIDLTGETESEPQTIVTQIPSGDSLIEAACLKLTEINAIVRENQDLRRQLRYSTETIQSLHVENTRIRAIVSDSRFNHIGPLKEELDLLQARGDFSPENVIQTLQIFLQDIKMHERQIDIIEAENESLKQQLALLEARLHTPSIPAEPELSTDIPYLQSTVDDLRNEVLQLRAMEEQHARIRVEFDKLKYCIASIGGPEELSGLIKTSAQFGEIRCDRDRLRHLISNMVGIEDDLRKLKERAERTDQVERQLANLKAGLGEMGDISNASREKMNDEIERLRREKDEIQEKLSCESEMHDLQNQLRDYGRVKLELNMYKIHYNELMNEMRRVCVKLLQLEPELDQTRQRLLAAESTICSNEHEIDELMELICDLSNENKTLIDRTKSHDSQTQKLIDLSKNVAVHIEREFEARQRLQDELESCRFELMKLEQMGIVAQDHENIDQTDSGHSLADCNCSDCLCRSHGNFAIELNISMDSYDSESTGPDIARPTPYKPVLNQESSEKSRLTTIKDSASTPEELDSTRTQLEMIRKQLLESQEENANLRDRTNQKYLEDPPPSALKTEKTGEFEEKPSLSKDMLTEYAKLKNEIEKLEGLLETSNRENEEKNKKLHSRQSQITELEQQIAKIAQDMEDSLNKCSEEIENIRAQFVEGKPSSNDKLEKYIEPANALDQCQSEFAKLKDQLTAHTINCKAEKEDMQTQFNNLNEQATEEISKLKLQIEALQTECNHLQSRPEKIPTGNENEVDSDMEELEDEFTEHDNTKADLIKQLEESNDKIENLNRLIEQHTHEREDYEEAKVAIQDLTEKYNQLEQNYASLHHHDASLQQALEDLNKDYESKALEWSEELAEYKSLLEQAQTSLETRRSEVSKLHEILKQESSEDFGEPLAQLTVENSKLKVENEKLRQPLEQLTAENSKLRAENEQLREPLAQLTTENSQLKAENEKLRSTIQLNEKQIASLQDNVHSINAKVEETLNSADRSEYIEKIEELKHEDDMIQNSELLNDLRREIDEVRFEKLQLEDELMKVKADKHATNEALKERIVKLESDLAEVKKSATGNDDVTKYWDDLKRLQDDNENLLKEKIQLKEDLKSAADNDNLTRCQDDLKRLQDDNEILLKENRQLREDLKSAGDNDDFTRYGDDVERLQNEIENLLKENRQLKEHLKSAGDNDDVTRYRDDLKRLQDENENFLKENKQLKADLKLLEDIVADIENESRKFEKLGVMIENFEQKSKDFESTPSLPPESIPSLSDDLSKKLQAEPLANNSQTNELEMYKKSLSDVQGKFKQCQKELKRAQATIGQLKLQEVELEKLKVSGQKCQKELDRCRDELRKIKDLNRNISQYDTTLARATSKDSPAMHSYESNVNDGNIFGEKSLTELRQTLSFSLPAHKIASTNDMTRSHDNPNDHFASTIGEIKAIQSKDLEKMQKMYEERIRVIIKNHEQEIELLRSANDTLQVKITDKSRIGPTDSNKSEQVTERLESDTNISDHDKRLNKICTKIIKSTINCLGLKELKYLHCAVYRAGVKIKPITASYNSEEIRRCCECTGFVCCLPCIPKDAEKKFMERINCLECELENANHVLQQLRDTYELKSNCSRRCCTMYSERRTVPPHGINDAVNQILKCARQAI